MLPKGLDCVEEPKPPNAGFCPNTDEPPNGADELPKAVVEAPKAGEDEAPNAGVADSGDEG